MTLFSLQKTLGLLAMPAGILWLLLLAAGLRCWRAGRKPFGTFLLATALLYACAGNVYVGGALLTRLEATVPRADSFPGPPFDAVFVLGGGSQENLLGHPQLDSEGDRLCMAARMWHRGEARLLVASGMNRTGLHGLRDGGEESRIIWRDLGVPDSAILVVKDPCWITRDEIAAYRRLQETFGWKRMALVSSASHLPRALNLAKKAGLPVTPVGANWRGRSLPFQLQYLVPQGEGFLDVQRACWEFLGRMVGR